MSKYANPGGGVSGRVKFVVVLVLLLAGALYSLIAAPAATANAVQAVIGAISEFVQTLQE